ncbi:hypothetical protein VM1G_09906 [Cytospora mali]|uniref:Uncharacterized protein n=1 Tax=Cytospora mali TaxID=578113 RepID=A0A194WDB9_CYTMA|nr:hypothetical protein VM1G_09906 [Valsa mali]
MFDDFTFGTPSEAETAGRFEDGQVCPQDEPSPASLSQPESRRRPHIPCAALDITSDHTIGCEHESPPDKEKTATIDTITNRLSDSHLRIDDDRLPPPLSRNSSPICSSSSSYFSPTALRLEVDYRYRKSSLYTGSRHGSSLSMSPAISSSSASPSQEDCVKHSLHPNQHVRRLRRQMSSKFNNDTQNTRAIKTLVEEMVSTGTQCNVYAPPLPSSSPLEADDTNRMDCESELSLEVDENPGDNSQERYQSPYIDQFLSLRRASGTAGVRKNAFPLLHRSSTDTALRCQHLVRNKPRMRKRPNLKR